MSTVVKNRKPTPSELLGRRSVQNLPGLVIQPCRLMGQDEEGTLGALKALRKSLIDSQLAEHLVLTTQC